MEQQQSDTADVSDEAQITKTEGEPAGTADEEDEAALDDLAAEQDDESADPDDSEPTEAGPELDDRGDTYTGVCRGGPYDGHTVTSRFPKGFLLADKEHSNAFVYDWNGQAYVCRDPSGAALDDDGAWRASEENTYDVIAMEPDHDAAGEVHS